MQGAERGLRPLLALPRVAFPWGPKTQQVGLGTLQPLHTQQRLPSISKRSARALAPGARTQAGWRRRAALLQMGPSLCSSSRCRHAALRPLRCGWWRWRRGRTRC